MVDVNEVAENIYLIDAQLYSIPKFGSVYLLNEEKKALIESGPTTSANVVLEGVRKVGVKPEDIAYIIVTHIHLDHAGGAGVLAGAMLQAQIMVHHRGAKHLVNPTKLVSGVVAARGEAAMAEYGEVLPIEEHRVQAIYHGDTIKLSDRQVLTFIDAPGHAPHEVGIYESRNGGLFTGDVVGINIPEINLLLLLHPPPSFDLNLCLDTLEKLMQLSPTKLYFSHFGINNQSQGTLQLAIDKLKAWDEVVDKAIKEDRFDSLVEKLIAQGYAELEPVRKMKSLYKYLKANVPLGVSGVMQYYQERHKV